MGVLGDDVKESTVTNAAVNVSFSKHLMFLHLNCGVLYGPSMRLSFTIMPMLMLPHVSMDSVLKTVYL